MTVNTGAQYTNDPDVTLTIKPPVGATGVRISNDGGFADAQSFPVSTTGKYAWKLDSSGPERLPKTVYVRFSSASELSAQNFTDDIILDETAPKVASAELASGATAASPVRMARLKTFKLKLKASDNASGVAKMQITTNKKRPGKALKFAKKPKFKAASAKIFVRVRDGAGNWSRWRAVKR